MAGAMQNLRGFPIRPTRSTRRRCLFLDHPGKTRPDSVEVVIHGQGSSWRLYFVLVDGRPRPRHLHEETAKGKQLGRVNLKTLENIANWTLPKDLKQMIIELKREGRL